ncbi:MAG: O-antigen ligase family protein [Candidatus Eisenbacteria bacterium]|nr:O-antigen ligase family protein [Candidatus Eisenbacteria bacterium]
MTSNAQATRLPAAGRVSRWWILALLFALALGVVATVQPVIAVLAVGGAILLVFALRDLSLLIAATLLFNMVGEPYHLALQSISIGGLNLYANDLLLIILAVALLLRGLRDRVVPALPKDPVSIALILFLGYGLFSLARSMPLFGSAAVTMFRVRFLYALLFFLAIPALADPRSRRRLLIAILVAAAWISLLGFYNAATGSFVGGRTSSHTYRYLSSLQALAIYFGLSLLIGVVWSQRRSLASLLLGGIYLGGILISQARSIWVGAIAGMLVAVFGSSNWKRNLVRLALPVGVVLLVFVLIGSMTGRVDIAEGIVTRATSFTTAPEDLTTVWRLYVWSEALNQLQVNPLFGLGLGHPFVYLDPLQDTWDDSRQLHNTYLDLAFSSGAIATALFVLFQALVFARTMRAARRTRRRELSPVLLALAASQVCLAATAFANVVGDSMVATIDIWILSAVSIVVAREAMEEPEAAAR